MAAISGECSERFAKVHETLARSLNSGADLGASVAVLLDGEPVVDIWGGFTDETRSTRWERDTIVNVWSTTKTISSLCLVMLSDRGEVDLDAPVARYWPEFAARGKEGVLVRHVLGHTAGLSSWDEPITLEDLYDWEKCTSLLARQAPWWEPGTASGYHVLTQGYLVGELVRRVTGQSVGAFVAEQIARPTGADFHIGLAPEHDHRVARVVPAPPPEANFASHRDTVAARTLANPVLDATWAWREKWRRAEIPAVNGHGNARSVARIHAALACGGRTGGTRLLSAEGCRAIYREQARGVDLVLGAPVRNGIGFLLNGQEMRVGCGERSCFGGGWGGSLVMVDPDLRLVVSFVMNRMGTEDAPGRGAAFVDAAYRALKGSRA
jgi:CubicO group peptidase (beta-lactamase class C family)